MAARVQLRRHPLGRRGDGPETASGPQASTPERTAVFVDSGVCSGSHRWSERTAGSWHHAVRSERRLEVHRVRGSVRFNCLRLRAARKEGGLTVAEIARAASASDRTVSFYLSGQRHPRAEVCLAWPVRSGWPIRSTYATS
ncbi:helix-turn-helix domain-containing protein [Streptomyces asiaticus]|uniref:helix-turn-helix domain-containing protein n=1 Tax=Streptomyces asiaticus TaxID=114695 RepID=UPI0035573CB7